MAKTILFLLLQLLISSILVVADEAAAAATKLSPGEENTIKDGIWKVVIDAVVAVAPPAKQLETMRAVLEHLNPLRSALDRARESGDDKKIADLAFSVKIAASLITRAAPPDKRRFKLMEMEDTFNSLAAPSPLDCPTVDKHYCETESKIQKAYAGVVAAAPAEKRLEVQAAVLQKPVCIATSTISKAYADGDEKEIAHVLAAYSKAADEVNAAAPADKLNVMDKTFADAGKNKFKH